ncbi:MAG: hypothetical protein ACRDHZ_24410 [Ktedonobacteraceae bacterium]
MTNEAYLGFQLLYSLLAPDPTLQSFAPGGVFRDEADPGTATPYVIVIMQSPGADSLTMVGVRLLTNPLYQVKAVGPSSLSSQIANAAAQIDTLLGGEDGLKNQSIAGGFIAALYRESPLMVGELVNGEKWQNIGGLYRLTIE